MADRTVVIRMIADTRGFTTGTLGAARSANNLSTAAAKSKSALTGLGGAAGLAGIAIAGGLAAGVVKSVSAFAEFDAAMTQSLAIMGDVSATMRTEMCDAARQVALTTQFSAEQAADSFFYLASAGLDAQQSIAALPQVAAFAQAGMFDMARATDLATDAQSALGLTVDDSMENLGNLTRVTDVLVKANTLANASVEQFSEALTSRFGAALRAANKDIEEGVAVLAALADQGVKGAEAGQSLNMVMSLLPKAAIANRDAFKKWNVQVFDAEGNMRNFADIVWDLEVAFGDLSFETRAMALEQLGFTSKTIGVANALIGTSGKIREYEQALRDSAGITQEVADNQMQTLTQQFGLLKSQIADTAIEMGTTLAPAMEGLMPLLEGAIGWFADFAAGLGGIAQWMIDLPGPIKTTAAAIGGLTVALKLASAHPLILGLTAVAAVVAKIGAAARDERQNVEDFVAALETAADLDVEDPLAGFKAIFEGKLDNKAILALERTGVTVEDLAVAAATGSDAYGNLLDVVGRAGVGPLDEFGAPLGEMNTDLLRIRRELDNLSPALAKAFDDQIVKQQLESLRLLGREDEKLIELARRYGNVQEEVADVTGRLVEIDYEMVEALKEMRAEAGQVAETFREDLIKEAQGFLTFFSKAPKKIDISLKEMQDNFEDRLARITEFYEGLKVLAAAGLDDLVAEMRAAGPDAAGVVTQLVNDMEAAFTMEGMLEDAKTQTGDWATDITSLLGIEARAWNALMFEAGQTMGSSLLAALSGEDLLTSLKLAGISIADAIQFGILQRPLSVIPPSAVSPTGQRNLTDPFWTKQMAAGGPVTAGSPYIVGERGPELFIPNQNGTINPNVGTTITVNNPTTQNLNRDLQVALLQLQTSGLVEAF